VAAAGRHSGRIEGQVTLNHDTSIRDDGLRAFATQQVEIAAIEYPPDRYQRDRFDRRTCHFVEWGAAPSVSSTQDLGTALLNQTTQLDDGLIEKIGSGIFVLTRHRPSRGSEGPPSSVHSSAARTRPQPPYPPVSGTGAAHQPSAELASGGTPCSTAEPPVTSIELKRSVLRTCGPRSGLAGSTVPGMWLSGGHLCLT
jgi:hypothetical protein